MGTIVSFADMRNARLKERLLTHALKGEGVIIETGTGSVQADKMFCRAGFVEVLNAYGDYFIVNYADVRSVTPAAVMQASAVNASGDWVAPVQAAPRLEPAPVVEFPKRRRQS